MMQHCIPKVIGRLQKLTQIYFDVPNTLNIDQNVCVCTYLCLYLYLYVNLTKSKLTIDFDEHK